MAETNKNVRFSPLGGGPILSVQTNHWSLLGRRDYIGYGNNFAGSAYNKFLSDAMTNECKFLAILYCFRLEKTKF
jgi:hypothetical protein